MEADVYILACPLLPCLIVTYAHCPNKTSLVRQQITWCSPGDTSLQTMIIDYNLTYPSGTATGLMIQSFFTTK
jgi:hypothetical protein